MAFSIRKMLSNITYFTKPGEEDNQKQSNLLLEKGGHTAYLLDERSSNIDFELTEPDSTSRCASLKFPDAVKSFAAKKGSFSDTDLLAIDVDKKDKRKKKLKLDIKKASQSLNENINVNNDSSNVENTPKHVLLDCQSADVFSERFKKFNFNQSFDNSDASSVSSYEEEDIDIETLSEQSDTEVSASSEEGKPPVKMCRKVDLQPDNQLVPSTTPESFGDVELEKNEEERISLLLKYQMKLEKIACVFQKLLTEFEFHIEVSKIFNCKSIVTALPGTDVSNIPKMLGDVTYMDNINRGISPAGSWNIVMEKEDTVTKEKLKSQLLSMKQTIDSFVNVHLQNVGEKKKILSQNRSLTFDMHKGMRQHKQNHTSYKKKMKHFDFPDLRDAMINLFSESEHDISNITKLHDFDDSDSKCSCSCHCNSTPTETDSGLTTKTDNTSDQSITSSIGNFSLDSSTLSAYSESLDLIISYNSFQDTSLYSTMLQKAAIERITFYVQVHSIQLKCEATEDFESKNVMLFHCPSCNITEYEENGLLKHILSQIHCEKIHFQYKTAYIKKCVSSGKEIQPSSVLNPMKMYRDENKIVCFGDAMYACSLCFENLIVGESILMAHCSNEEHLDKKEKLFEILE